MMDNTSAEKITAAIVDYGLGNLFSVRRACEQFGIQAVVTAEPKEMMKAERIFSGTRISSEKNLAVINPASIMIKLQTSMPAKMV